MPSVIYSTGGQQRIPTVMLEPTPSCHFSPQEHKRATAACRNRPKRPQAETNRTSRGPCTTDDTSLKRSPCPPSWDKRAPAGVGPAFPILLQRVPSNRTRPDSTTYFFTRKLSGPTPRTLRHTVAIAMKRLQGNRLQSTGSWRQPTGTTAQSRP